VLARDPYGIKPLYYRVDDDGTLAFASDLRALCVGQASSPEVDRHALAAYLAFNSVPSPLSIYAGIRKLPAGHVLTCDERGLQISRYARPRPADREDLRREPLATLAPELLDRLRDSVRAHLVADVPVGVLLSGGVDSGALTALAAEASAARVRTFSVGFEDSSFDELAGARLVARRYDTDHREVVLRADAVAWLEAVAGAFDEPFADSSAVATYLVCGLASEHVKVVLSGEGADELFGGYYTYVADSLAPRIGRLAGAAAPVVRRLPSSSARASFDYRLKRFVQAAALPALERHHGWKEIFSEDARASLLLDAADLDDPVDLLRRRFAETEGAEALARLQDVDVGVYLADDLLVKTDRTSMAHSVEARVPFLDREVAALAYALPRSARVRGLDKKRLLRRAVAPLLPREVVHGRKRGFSIPAAGWLRGDLVPFAREVLSPAAVRRQGFFDPAAVNRLLERHIAGREDVSRQLWGLLSFALWYEQRDAARSGATGLPSSLVR
jgi:asparagine synthase (glutamine-hydrolysing)